MKLEDGFKVKDEWCKDSLLDADLGADKFSRCLRREIFFEEGLFRAT